MNGRSLREGIDMPEDDSGSREGSIRAAQNRMVVSADGLVAAVREWPRDHTGTFSSWIGSEHDG